MKRPGRCDPAVALNAINPSVRPAPLSLRPEMVPRRTSSTVEHRMALAARAAPPTGPAAFGNLDDRAVGNSQRCRCHSSTGETGKTKCQGGADKHGPNHPVPPSVLNKSLRFTERAGKS